MTSRFQALLPRALEVQFAIFGVAAIYTAPGGEPRPITIMLRDADAQERFQRGAGVAPAFLLDIRASDVEPVRDAIVEHEGITYRIQGKPRAIGVGRHVYRCDAVKG
ncbi:MAG: hypothetical protein P1U84_12165 [Parvibaculaceae bacterium]|nr:hypothetical protein [Parvibaculaceae bacterium]